MLTRFLMTKTEFLMGVSEEQQFAIGGALLRHICQLVCNAHAITDILPGRYAWGKWELIVFSYFSKKIILKMNFILCNLEDNTSATSPVVDEYQKRIATAIYPAASIMNHSCDSNIRFYVSLSKYFQFLINKNKLICFFWKFKFLEGKKLIVKGGRAIKKGDNIFNCYGPHYRRMRRSERQEILGQQYFFKCVCDKCNEEEQEGISFAVSNFKFQ